MQSLYYVQYNQPSPIFICRSGEPCYKIVWSLVHPRATSAILQKTNNGENRRAASCLHSLTAPFPISLINPIQPRPNPILCSTCLRGSESHWIAVSGRLHIPLLTPLGRSLGEFDVLENLLISSVVQVLARISGRNCVDTIAKERLTGNKFGEICVCISPTQAKMNAIKPKILKTYYQPDALEST